VRRPIEKGERRNIEEPSASLQARNNAPDIGVNPINALLTVLPTMEMKREREREREREGGRRRDRERERE